MIEDSSTKRKNKLMLIAGPCAVETPEQTYEMAYKVSLVRDALQPLGIEVGYRGGAWKPRTQYHNTNGDKVFEGTREQGLHWLSEVAEKYDLPIVTECMSEHDIRHFERELEPDRDFIQIGARNSQNFALLYTIGGTPFNVLLKSPQHGVDVKEAVGSLQRLKRNKIIAYCVRGQKRFIYPDSEEDEIFSEYMKELMQSPGQNPEARNLNNIGSIINLRQNSYIRDNGIMLCYDPSHTLGGKNDELRRMIGEQAIRAVKEFGYEMLEIEANDHGSYAKVDGAQALLISKKNVDWTETNYGQESNLIPGQGKEPEVTPITIVDIASEMADFQAEKLELDYETLRECKNKLDAITWNMIP